MSTNNEPIPEERAGREATEDCDAIEARIRSKINMDSASPADWIWETLAVLEADGRLAAQPSIEGNEDEGMLKSRDRQSFDAGFAAGCDYKELAKDYARQLVEKAVADRIDDKWLVAARDYLGKTELITAERGSKCLHTKTTKIGIASDAMYHCHPVMKCDACGEEIIERGNGER